MDVDGVVTYAKDALLALGDYPPCILVEVDKPEYVCIMLPDLGTASNALERARISFFGGRKFAQTTAKKHYKGQKFIGVYSIAKVWYTMTVASEAKNTPYVKPSLNPRRKEGFNIISLDPNTMEQGQVLYDILRDGSGAVVDLFKDPEMKRTGPVQSAFLPCFMAGMRTCEQPHSQAIHEFRRTFDRYAPPLPDEMG
ncbi:MAG TPA: hypothetical protein VN207_11520 [Ktedonobacteraceae bacterium]|nr:hypothetical protein [Ktedonobacteraceae bacterium]